MARTDLSCNKSVRPIKEIQRIKSDETASAKSKPDLVIYVGVEINGEVCRLCVPACMHGKSRCGT